MFNNTVFNVAIGLIFIYLLYSLLATTVKEFVATLFSYRARMLEKGLEQMLDGVNYSYYWWDRLWNYIYKKNKDNPGSKFFIKKHLFTNSISCHPLYKRSGENSFFFKNEKPAYLSADVFADILLDVLNPKKGALPQLIDIAEAVQKGTTHPDLNAELKQIITLYIQQASGDLQRFRMLIEGWYNDTMDRVGGWYKRQANRILICIGLCLAMAFNVSTIDIVKMLSRDKDVRNALVSNATDYVKNHLDDIKPSANNSTDTSRKNDTASATGDKETGAKDTVAVADTTFEMLKSKVNSMKSLYNTNIAEANTTMGLGWGDFGYSEDSSKFQQDLLQFIKDSTACADSVRKNQKYGCNFDLKSCRPSKPGQPNVIEKIGYVIYKTITTPHFLLGFLITAFAISLGAPFWFDLLNKFVNLRISGAKPDAGTPVSKTVLLTSNPDSTEKE